MNDPRFRKLEEELLAAGVAGRHARRAAMEMEDHFEELVRSTVARGKTDAVTQHAVGATGEIDAAARGELDAGVRGVIDARQFAIDAAGYGAIDTAARAEAHAALGNDEALVARYAARPELLAWSKRWPAAWFTLSPIIAYVLASVLTLAMLVLVLESLKDHLRAMHVSPQASHAAGLCLHAVICWVYPSLIAAGFCAYAYRRRAPLRWPLTGMVLLSVFASLVNVHLVLRTGAGPGEIGAGLGVSSATWLSQSIRITAVAALAAVLPWLVSQRQPRRSRSMGEAAE
jgi:hypothetical protein